MGVICLYLAVLISLAAQIGHAQADVSAAFRGPNDVFLAEYSRNGGGSFLVWGRLNNSNSTTAYLLPTRYNYFSSQNRVVYGSTYARWDIFDSTAQNPNQTMTIEWDKKYIIPWIFGLPTQARIICVNESYCMPSDVKLARLLNEKIEDRSLIVQSADDWGAQGIYFVYEFASDAILISKGGDVVTQEEERLNNSPPALREFLIIDGPRFPRPGEIPQAGIYSGRFGGARERFSVRNVKRGELSNLGVEYPHRETTFSNGAVMIEDGFGGDHRITYEEDGKKRSLVARYTLGVPLDLTGREHSAGRVYRDGTTSLDLLSEILFSSGYEIDRLRHTVSPCESFLSALREQNQ